MSKGGPTRDQVLAWLSEVPSRTAEDAVDHFWRGHHPNERAKLLARVRQWVSRSKKKPAELHVLPRPSKPADEDDAEDGEGGGLLDKLLGNDMPPRPEADYAWARLERIAFLERQLAEDLADLTWARQMGALKSIAGLDRRVSDVRVELDNARGEAARVVKLDRNPAEVAAEVKRQQRALDLLAERDKRREAARAAAAATAATPQRDL